MKNCREIQRELSAYLDGELTPSLRTGVERHLASCMQCQQELSEMKMLATGVAALPNLEPPPRFLAEVRRKIARPGKPEPVTWQDYAFRPLWLKVPLEAAVLLGIIAFIMRSEHPQPVQKVAQLQSARMVSSENDHVNGVSSETAAKVTALDALKITSMDRAQTASTPQSAPTASVAGGDLSSPRELLKKDEKSADAMGTHGATIAGDTKQFADKPMGSEMAAGSANVQSLGDVRRIPSILGNDEASLAPPAAPSPIVGVVRNIELAQSKLSDTVTVHARDFDEVRNRAQQLAARCSGKVVVAPQAKDVPDQTLFVELPQEYVAAFKLELLKTSGPSTATARGGSYGQPGSTNAATPVTGVLTGNALTNNSINAPGSLGLRDDATVTPKTILEIRIVAPAN